MKSDCSSTPKSVELMIIEHWKLLPQLHQYGAARAAQAYVNTVAAAGNSLSYFSSESDDGVPWQLLAWPLEWDSKFFGFKTARLDLIAPPIDVFNKENEELGRSFIESALFELQKNGFEFLSAQIDVSDTAAMQCLELNGFLLADTIVGYELSLAKLTAQENRSSASLCQQHNIRPATSSDEQALRAIAADCFGKREANVNRFNSELKFSQDQVREMYELWIANSIKGTLADSVLLYEEGGTPIGFITIRLPSASELSAGINCAAIPLNAVSRAHQGKGVYRQLVFAALNWLKVQNCDAVQIKTQLPNRAVHSCWQSLGARIYTSLHTFQKDFTRTFSSPGSGF